MLWNNCILVLDNFPHFFDAYSSSLKSKPPHSVGKKQIKYWQSDIEQLRRNNKFEFLCST